MFVADEPTLGLAPLAAEEIMDAIRRLRDLGSTILLVEEKAHEVLEVADTVAFMELGRLVWMGPCDQLDEERLAGHLPGDGDVSLRVVHWGTGNTGRLALRGVLQHPDLELVGLYVHSPDKVGRDAGELIGLRRDRGDRDQRRRRAARRSTPTASATWATASARGRWVRSRR